SPGAGVTVSSSTIAVVAVVSSRAQRLVLREQRPGDARILVGDRHQRAVVTAPRPQLEDPARHAVLVSARRVQYGARALYQEIAKVGIAPLADVTQARLAAGGVLARSQADPGGELPAVLELT